MIPVCIFAKPPVAGQVKTRLIPAFGAKASAELAAAMLQDTWAVISLHPNVRPVLACGVNGEFPIAPPAGDCWPQPEGDLGVRLEEILRRGLTHAPAAIALGADTPLLTTNHIEAALSNLHTSDAVLGPASDGGFYLLGVSRCPPGLLSGIAWSAAHTARATRDKLRSQAFRIAEIAELPDVDMVEDVCALAAVLEVVPDTAPATRRWFARYFAHAR